MDFKPDHLAVTKLNTAGAKVALARMELVSHQTTCRLNKTQLQEAAKVMVGRSVAAWSRW